MNTDNELIQYESFVFPWNARYSLSLSASGNVIEQVCVIDQGVKVPQSCFDSDTDIRIIFSEELDNVIGTAFYNIDRTIYESEDGQLFVIIQGQRLEIRVR